VGGVGTPDDDESKNPEGKNEIVSKFL